MKQFLKKNKWRILYWGIFLLIILYLAPRQSDYYLDEDIQNFKRSHVVPTLTWLWVFLSVLFLVVAIIRIRQLTQAFFPAIYACVLMACFLFIFQDVFLAGSLFINRQFKRSTFTKEYVASRFYTADSIGINERNFIPYDLSKKQISIDPKLKARLYRPGLQQNDTIRLTFKKGLFGIPILTKAPG